MIYHFFTADRTHLCPSLIKGFSFIIDSTKHVFVLYQCSSDNKVIYEDLKRNLKLKFIYISDIDDFSNTVKDRSIPILLHSVNRDWLVSLNKKEYSCGELGIYSLIALSVLALFNNSPEDSVC